MKTNKTPNHSPRHLDPDTRTPKQRRKDSRFQGVWLAIFFYLVLVGIFVAVIYFPLDYVSQFLLESK